MTSTEQEQAGRAYLKDHNETIDKPPGPWMGFWSMYYIDRVRVFKIMLGHLGLGGEGYIQKLYQKSKTTFPPGEEFPAIDLETTTGERVNTADFKGQKHFVLMTGALT